MPYVTQESGEEAFIVTTPDGTFFRCFVQAVGGVDHPRWIFETTTVSHFGPSWYPIAHESHLQQIVQDWFSERTQLALDLTTQATPRAASSLGEGGAAERGLR
jgi:hypothetical protein